MSNRKRDLMIDTPWFLHPARNCKDRPEFADLTLLKPRPRLTRRQQIAMLVELCEACPVLKECRIDLLSHTNNWDHYGVQAGIVGKK